MITPNKYTNLDLSVLNIGAEIVKVLQKSRILKYDDLLSQILLKKGRGAKEIFVYSLNFLFVLNIIKYHSSEDIIEFYETR